MTGFDDQNKICKILSFLRNKIDASPVPPPVDNQQQQQQQQQTMTIRPTLSILAVGVITLLLAPQHALAQDACDEYDLKSKMPTDFSNHRCDCSESGDFVEYQCRTRRDICLTSGDDSAEFEGSETTTVTLEGVNQPSYARKIVTRSCFQYKDLYDGKEVCHQSNSDGLGKTLDCRIEVASEACTDCQFCAIRDDNFKLLSGFDCSNVGAESARECTSDSAGAANTILRFLSDPRECGRSSSSAAPSRSTSSSTGSSTGSPTFAATLAPTKSGSPLNTAKCLGTAAAVASTILSFML